MTHLLFSILGGGNPGTLFSLDLGPKGGSNFKALWRSHLTSVRGPISYRIRFMARRSFFVFFPLMGGGVRRLVENSTIFFWNPPLSKRCREEKLPSSSSTSTSTLIGRWLCINLLKSSTRPPPGLVVISNYIVNLNVINTLSSLYI